MKPTIIIPLFFLFGCTNSVENDKVARNNIVYRTVMYEASPETTIVPKRTQFEEELEQYNNMLKTKRENANTSLELLREERDQRDERENKIRQQQLISENNIRILDYRYKTLKDMYSDDNISKEDKQYINNMMELVDRKRSFKSLGYSGNEKAWEWPF